MKIGDVVFALFVVGVAMVTAHKIYGSKIYIMFGSMLLVCFLLNLFHSSRREKLAKQFRDQFLADMDKAIEPLENEQHE